MLYCMKYFSYLSVLLVSNHGAVQRVRAGQSSLNQAEVIKKRDVYGDDGSPVLWTEEEITWTEGTANPDEEEQDDDEANVEEALVSNDDESGPASPVELQEKARGLLVEEETKDRIGKVKR